MKRLLLLAALASASAAAEDPRRPLLVSVDDLPIGSDRLHTEADDRSRITEGLLATLRQHAVPAVGLVTWGNLRSPAEEDLLQRWLDAGHELGNHSFRHRSYTALSIPEYLADVEEARSQLAAFLAPRGKPLRFFRFPFLREGDTKEKLQAMRDWLEPPASATCTSRSTTRTGPTRSVGSPRPGPGTRGQWRRSGRTIWPY